MGRLESLVRAITWLIKRDWGRALLLGVCSIVAFAVIPENRITAAILDGPVFRAGFYVGTVLMPSETIGGHSLFGIALVFLFLVGLWFVILLLIRRLSLIRDNQTSRT